MFFSLGVAISLAIRPLRFFVRNNLCQRRNFLTGNLPNVVIFQRDLGRGDFSMEN